jgi:hypothetical protein
MLFSRVMAIFWKGSPGWSMTLWPERSSLEKNLWMTASSGVSGSGTDLVADDVGVADGHFFLALVELGADDGEGEVDEEEGADEDDRDEVGERDEAEGGDDVLVGHAPALHGGHHEHHQEGVGDVVEAVDARHRVGADLRAEEAGAALQTSPA